MKKVLIAYLTLVLLALIKIGDGVIFLAQTSTTPFRNLFAQIAKHARSVKKQSVIFQRKPTPVQTVMAKPVLPLPHKVSLPSFSIKPFVQKGVSTITTSVTKVFALRKFFIRKRGRGRPRKEISITPNKIKPQTRTLIPFIIRFRYFIAGIIFSFFFLFIPLLIFIFIQDLPSPQMLTLGQIPQTTKIYDRNGKLLYQIYALQNRTLVPLSQVPQSLQNATIAIEDKNFYEHVGFDLSAIIRSAVENFSANQKLQGGSTITQQLIKSSLLTSETSISRKIKEVILAFWAERLYTKKQILELYFNHVPYGGTAYGVEAAAQTYFGKSVKDVTLAESAFLAGIPQAPTTYSPYGQNPKAWKDRQKEVLKRMVELDYITPQQAKDAETEELVFRAPQTPIHAPHFVMYVKDYLAKKYGLPMVEKGGLNVVTSLDLSTQEMAETVVRDEVNNSAHLLLTNGAAVVTNPTNGDILAMVGSRDFSYPGYGNFNLATSLRQPGSSIKIVTYTAALENGYTAATIIDDSPVTFPGSPPYTPVNYDSKSHGRVPLRIAFANSYNITAVRTLNHVGVPTFINLGKKMGVRSWGEADQYGLSVTLGAAEATMLDMATVFGTMAKEGQRVDVNPILKITDYKGSILEEKPEDVRGEQVVDPAVSFIVSDILADNSARSAAFGPNSVLNIPGKYVSVKTGTSDNKRDNWAIGYTQERVVTVWVGNNNNTPMHPNLASGITGASPIWNKIMVNLLKDAPAERRAIPANVVQKTCLGRVEYFKVGTENSVNCAPLPSPRTTQQPQGEERTEQDRRNNNNRRDR